mgnify:CR=1 FL=1
MINRNTLVKLEDAIREIFEIVEKQLNDEEIDFNGRWCDDGGRNME